MAVEAEAGRVAAAARHLHPVEELPPLERRQHEVDVRFGLGEPRLVGGDRQLVEVGADDDRAQSAELGQELEPHLWRIRGMRGVRCGVT